jgi:hypothetical protein
MFVSLEKSSFMMAVLIDVIIVYFATSTEILFIFVRDLLFGDDITQSVAGFGGYAAMNAEAAGFLLVFYILSYLGYLNTKNRFALAVSAAGFDIVYVLAYKPLLRIVQIDVLDAYIWRILVFSFIYFVLLFAIKSSVRANNRLFEIASKYFPSNEHVEGFFKDIAVIYLAGVAFIASTLTLLYALAFLLSRDTEGLGFAATLLLAQMVPLIFTPFVYAVICLFAKYGKQIVWNTQTLAGITIFACVPATIFALRFDFLGLEALHHSIRTLLYVFGLLLSMGIGVLVYEYRKTWFLRIFLWLCGIAFCILLAFLILIALIDNFGLVEPTKDCELIAQEQADAAVQAQRNGYGNKQTTHEEFYKIYLERCASPIPGSVSVE